MQDNMKKNIIWNLVGTTSNAFNSLFFMVIVTRINGMNDSGIFTLAFSLACLFCIIGGYEGRVYQVTDIKNEFNEKEYIFHRYITIIIMMLIVIFYTMYMKYDLTKMLITISLCGMKALEVLADVYYGIMQKYDNLYIVGKSLFIKSILSIALFLIVDLVVENLLISCLFLDAIWLLIFLFYDLPKAKQFIPENLTVNYVKILKLFKSGFFSFGILFLSVYLVNAPKYALDGRVSENIQAVYGIILMPATIISLMVQYLLQPFLNKMSNNYFLGKKKEFNRIVFTMILSILIFGIICIIIASFLGIPVLNLLYGVKIDTYKMELILIISGAILYSLSTLLSASLTTVRYTFIQFVVFCISSIFGYFISIILIEKFQLYGASLAYLLIMSLQFLLYFISYLLVMKKIEFNGGSLKNGEN